MNFNQERKLRNRRPVWPACEKCGHALPGEVCPDCFTCRACTPGCIECLPYRPKVRKT